MASETVTLKGHIIDSLTLPKVLDEILNGGASYEILDLQVGVNRDDVSSARIQITGEDEARLDALLDRLQQFGANPEGVEDARLAEAEVDGSFPKGFYSSTNLDTDIRIEGNWVRVERTEMDCGIVLEEGGARTIPMGEVRAGMQIVMAGRGIRVHQLEKPKGQQRQEFEFMSSAISSEKPKALQVETVARRLRAVKDKGERILWVAGPAVVHTGAGPDLCALIRAGYVDAFFAGNGVAAHDIESNMFGTSLGVHLSEGIAAEHGHEHHIRAINEVRRHGSFSAAIDAGVFNDGIVHHLVTNDCDFLFGGSVRDDGPLPEVVTDMLEVQQRLRALIWGEGTKRGPGDGNDLIGFCMVLGTMLHGIATGNCLPAAVPLVCVDINQATVTKLMDRGSWQSIGIITDLGLFVRELAEELAPDEVRAISADQEARHAGARTRR